MPRFLLTPFGLLYGAATRARGEFYRRGIFKSYDLPGFTASVGNITVGGTGKTPLVALVAEMLAASGERACILTRGYGRKEPKERVVVSDGETVFADARQAGDEPFELALKLKGAAAVVADADRVAAAQWASENLKSTAFVLDDGFQHRRARRDFDIVCIDATAPFGNGRLLPAGVLREPLDGLKRADAFLLTRADLVGDKEISEIERFVRRYNEQAPIFTGENRLARLTDLREFLAEAAGEKESGIEKNGSRLPTAGFLAFCALGNPENFFAHLKKEKFELAAVRAFRDHHFYTQKDVDDLEREATRRGAAGFLTTAKDAVKLAGLKVHLPCRVVENELVLSGGRAFEELLVARLYKSKGFSETVSERVS